MTDPLDSGSPAPADCAADETLRQRLSALWSKSVADDTLPDVTIKRTSAVRPEPDTGGEVRTVETSPGGPHAPRAGETLEGEEPSRFEIMRLLGEGGMGMVYQARQTSVDRTIALKMIKPEVAQEDEARTRFRTEASATADLDHPNIVPVHDLGTDRQGALFYAMKEVRGRPWGEVLGNNSPDENLDILIRVADAVAFAHSKGIIHRDLKPDNVMLGDYGEVLLMDWGLAAAVRDGAKAERLEAGHAAGGTPCYMAPEMATGDIAKIGPGSDVYLLGAILYELATGVRAHAGKTAMACLGHAALNEVQPTDKQGELIDIARKAMATEPADRYAGVKEFQQAVQTYRRHAESILLASTAADELAAAEEAHAYARYAEAVSSFRQALKLWAGNTRAQTGLRDARYAYAAVAFRNRDYDLAASLLDDVDEEQRKLADRVATAKRERDARRRRVRVLGYASATLAAAVLIVSVVGFFWVRAEQKRTFAQKTLAEQALADFRAEQAARAEDRKASAPALVRSARTFAEQADLEAATTTVDAAIEFDPAFAPARQLRAALLLTAQTYGQAAAELEAFLATGGRDPDAARFLEISQTLQAGNAEATALAEVGAILGRWGLPTLGAEFLSSAQARLALYRQKIEATWPGLGRRLLLNADHQLSLSLNACKQVGDLAPLRGIPLCDVMLMGCPVADLGPLEGMQITKLNVTVTKVKSLAPLAGMPLRVLFVKGTSVTDLSPLAGMRLEHLDVNLTQISDLTPLHGMPLQRLNLGGCRGVTDLSPLQGSPLTWLHLAGTTVRDLTPLAGMPLEYLVVNTHELSDLEPLAGMPLRELNVSGSRVADLTPLRGMPLEVFIANGAHIADLEPLRGMPLRKLSLAQSKIADLAPLEGMPLTELHIDLTLVRDLTPLEGVPLTTLGMCQTEIDDLSPLENMALAHLRFDPARIVRGLGIVRAMETIASFGFWPSGQVSAADFWERYDAGGILGTLRCGSVHSDCHQRNQGCARHTAHPHAARGWSDRYVGRAARA